MTVRRALREAIARLTSARVPSASTTAEVLLLHVLERDRAFLYAHPEAELTLEQERAYRHLLRERSSGKPTQYLTGRQEFWGLIFRIEPGVFIPRPETEHVVEVALGIVREHLQKPQARIVDVGTGTGCIALALASELPQAEILATDVSRQALVLARRNAEALGLAECVRFLQCDLLEPLLVPEHGSQLAGRRPCFDLIVSNPPYVSLEEAERLPREVRDYEPPVALFSEGEGIALTRRLIQQAEQLLAGRGFSEQRGNPASFAGNPSWREAPEVQDGRTHPGPRAEGGWLVVELGYDMHARVRALLGEAWANVEVTPDLRGIPRVLAAQRK